MLNRPTQVLSPSGKFKTRPFAAEVMSVNVPKQSRPVCRTRQAFSPVAPQVTHLQDLQPDDVDWANCAVSKAGDYLVCKRTSDEVRFKIDVPLNIGSAAE
jgi:hypothetical protein